MLELNTGDIALITTLLTAILGGLAYYNSRKLANNDATSVITDSATKLIEPLKCRLDELEKENNNLKEENKMLTNRLTLLEKALLESPIYRIFFELTQFACVIIDADNGLIYDVNKSFSELYGYNNEQELHGKSIYDLTLQPEKTKDALLNKTEFIPDRLHKNKNGQAFLVEIHASYYEQDNKKFALCIYLPILRTTIGARIQDILSEVIDTFDSDYSTLWCIHNHGVDKVSALYESVRKGNGYLLQDYLNMPSSIFDELFTCLKEEKYILLNVNDDKLESVRMLMKRANLDHIIILGIFDGDKLVGLLSTSWRSMLFNPDSIKIQYLMDYAKSRVLLEALSSSVMLENK